MAEQEWAGTTQGTSWMHRTLIRMLRYLDVRLFYAFSAVFVIPVCLALNTNSSRTHAYRYFRLRHKYSPLKAAWKTYTNHCLFAQVVIDRFAMYAGKKFQLDMEGYEHFLNLAAQPEGFFQFSSHIGNYELAGYSLVAENKTFHALVFAGEKALVMDNRNRMFASTNIRMIAIQPDMSHLFEINSALQSGETVSMPADRIFGSQKAVTHPFLNAPARFPMGPFSIATMRGLNVLAVNVMKTGCKRYRIYVTPLEYDKTAGRKEQIEQLSRAYVAELERMVKTYPAQWYNYFEFWT